MGSHIAELLVNRGHEIILVTRTLEKLRNVASFKDGVRVDVMDITDSSALKKLVLDSRPDVVFHLAGQLTSYESFEKPFYDVEVNLKSTLALLEAIREARKSCRVVLGSTFWVVGRPPSLPVNEDTPCRPRNLYAANRLASEYYCQIYNEVYDLDTVVMRYTNTFGPREQKDNRKKAAINYLIYRGFRGQPITIYGKGKFFRDVLYATDAASAAIAIMEKGRSGERYFVGSGRETWFYEIGNWIHEFTGAPIEYVEPPDYHKRVDVGNFLVDNSKTRALGWECMVSVKEGIKRTLEYYRTDEQGSGS